MKKKYNEDYNKWESTFEIVKTFLNFEQLIN